MEMKQIVLNGGFMCFSMPWKRDEWFHGGETTSIHVITNMVPFHPKI
jgi:hypothetical protein